MLLLIESIEAERLHSSSGTKRTHNSRLLANDMAKSGSYHCNAYQSI